MPKASIILLSFLFGAGKLKEEHGSGHGDTDKLLSVRYSLSQ